MNDKQKIVTLVAGLIGQDSVLTINKVILKKLEGDKNTALLLSQIMYWSKTMDKEWFYKTDESWREELFLSEWELRSSKEKLKKMGLIDTKLKRATGLTILHYSINYNKIYDFLTSDLSVTQKRVCVRLKSESECDSNVVHRLHTENTTKNTESKKPCFATQSVKNLIFKNCISKQNYTRSEAIAEYFFHEFSERLGLHPEVSDKQMTIGLDNITEFLSDHDDSEIGTFINDFFQSKVLKNSGADFRWNLFTNRNVLQARCRERWESE